MGQDERRKDPNRIPDLERRMDEVARALNTPEVGLLALAKRHGHDIGLTNKDVSLLRAQIREVNSRLEELRTQQLDIEKSFWSRLGWLLRGYRRFVRVGTKDLGIG